MFKEMAEKKGVEWHSTNMYTPYAAQAPKKSLILTYQSVWNRIRFLSKVEVKPHQLWCNQIIDKVENNAKIKCAPPFLL